ncbi:hypothetical protein GCM10023215_40800 [Pseudonocardia yuanmonensis]|uniref:Uncharacterized protein n=1 Tax=Pseudonocardia yuanmonensis TaxID=1095914 RepID=A0ABP8X0W4_9PSEU
MIRMTSAVLGGIALTTLAGGVLVGTANAAPVIAGPPTEPGPAVAGNPLWATDHVPVPVDDPTFGAFDLLAPAYGLVGGVD